MENVVCMGLFGRIRNLGFVKHFGDGTYFCRSIFGVSLLLLMPRVWQYLPLAKAVISTLLVLRSEGASCEETAMTANFGRWMTFAILTEAMLVPTPFRRCFVRRDAMRW